MIVQYDQEEIDAIKDRPEFKLIEGRLRELSCIITDGYDKDKGIMPNSKLFVMMNEARNLEKLLAGMFSRMRPIFKVSDEEREEWERWNMTKGKVKSESDHI